MRGGVVAVTFKAADPRSKVLSSVLELSAGKTLLRLYEGSIKALLRLYAGSMKALRRLYDGSMTALLRLY